VRFEIEGVYPARPAKAVNVLHLDLAPRKTTCDSDERALRQAGCLHDVIKFRSFIGTTSGQCENEERRALIEQAQQVCWRVHFRVPSC